MWRFFSCCLPGRGVACSKKEQFLRIPHLAWPKLSHIVCAAVAASSISSPVSLSLSHCLNLFISGRILGWTYVRSSVRPTAKSTLSVLAALSTAASHTHRAVQPPARSRQPLEENFPGKENVTSRFSAPFISTVFSSLLYSCCQNSFPSVALERLSVTGYR